MNPIKSIEEGIALFTPAADYSSKEGYGVTLAGDTATLSASATTRIKGVVLVGGTVAQGVSVAIPGAIDGAVKLKISGTVTRGDYLMQSTDGTFVTTSAGARVEVAVANQSGVSGDLIDAFLITPTYFAA